VSAPGAADWHDVECASYDADLPLWRELAANANGRILDVGAGTGRVALDLARRGHDVTAVDSEAELLAALVARAAAEDLDVEVVVGDARAFSLAGRFALVLLPMQVVQLLGGEGGRASMLAAVKGVLAPGGRLAVALADPWEAVPAGEALPPLPDILERDGWVLSSLPVGVRVDGDRVAIDRVRQAVAPNGGLTDEFATIVLDAVTPDELEREALGAGYRIGPQRYVDPTRDYVGSAVVMLEAQ
jgi:SAM-dependent methyltransferase